MIGLTAVVVGVLFSASVYLMVSGDRQHAAFGFVALANAANLVVLAASGLPGGASPPLLGGDGSGPYPDPLPQAFILTAIVIGLANTAYLIYLTAAADLGAGADGAEVEGSESD
jgi:multicomponent Na+:H+ antiporter subunit C